MPKTLLLADDSVTIQKVVEISFASEDVILHTVDNGDDAIGQVRELRPDLVLADVVMPGKSGYEVCEAINSDPELRHIPVLLLTGTFEAFDEERAAQGGAAGHIAKPFEAQRLVDQAMRLIAEPSSPAPVASAAATETETEKSFTFDDAEFDALLAADVKGETGPRDEPDTSQQHTFGESERTQLGETLPTDHTEPVQEAVPDVEASLSNIHADQLLIDSEDLARSTLLSPGTAAAFDVAMTDLHDDLPPPAEPEGDSDAHIVGELTPLPRDSPTVSESPSPAPADMEPLREQLHETLEKIAWESFGKLSEDLVEQTVARVEAIAWEVIPQMVELLVREEIRKLKEQD